jgi:hypothetical protein
MQGAARSADEPLCAWNEARSIEEGEAVDGHDGLAGVDDEALASGEQQDDAACSAHRRT